MTVPSYIYVVDTGNDRIIKRTASNQLSYRSQVSYATTILQQIATDVTYFYVVDQGNHRIQKMLLDGTNISYFGSQGTGDGQFDQPRGICTAGTHLYICDTVNHRIKKHLCSDMSYVSQFGTNGSGDNQFSSPRHITTDGVYLYICDTANHRIKKHLCSDLSYVSQIGSSGTGDDQFSSPVGITTDSAFIYIMDTGNHRLKKHQCSDLSYVSKIGGPAPGSGNDGFSSPEGIITDGTYLFIADTGNYRIFKRYCSDLSFISMGGTSGSGDNFFSLPDSLILVQSSVASHEGKFHVALATSLRPYLSNDFGANFFQTSSTAASPSYAWRRVSTSANGKYILLVCGSGNAGAFLSNDYGVTFNSVSAPLLYYNSCAMSDSGQYMIASHDSGTNVSNDYGVTWPSATGANVRANVACSGTGQYMVMGSYDVGFVYMSSNYGASFSRNNSEPSRSWQSFGISYDGSIIMGTSAGIVPRKSIDYGATWNTISGGVPASPAWTWNYEIACSSTGQYQIIANYSTGIYMSSDYGETFVLVGVGAVYSCAISSSGKYCAMGQSGGYNWTSDNYGVAGSWQAHIQVGSTFGGVAIGSFPWDPPVLVSVTPAAERLNLIWTQS